MTELYQNAVAYGNIVTITSKWRPQEIHAFESPKEAAWRAAVVNEMLSWMGTPFKNCADTKGENGGVDCAMSLIRSFVDTGVLAPFDPRPYPPQWHVHHDEERFLNLITQQLGAVEIDAPRIGDIAVFHWGRCYSHGALIINNEEVCHAFYKTNCVTVMRRDETDLVLRGKSQRPVKYFRVA
jgi:cell wall-associated NlpC family hydrolase